MARRLQSLDLLYDVGKLGAEAGLFFHIFSIARLKPSLALVCGGST